jgi:hypothetical protein
LKKVNKKRTVTLGRVIIFFEYLKASIADLITLLSVQNGHSLQSFVMMKTTV